MEDNTTASKKRRKEGDDGCSRVPVLMEQHRKRRSSTFLGVFAISRPKTSSRSQSLSSSTNSSLPAVSPAHRLHQPEQPAHDDRPENTTTSTLKRKRTPSDGSSPQSSGDSLNPQALIAQNEPSPQLRLRDSLESVSEQAEQSISAYAISQPNPQASTSTLPPLSLKSVTSAASTSSRSTALPVQAEQQLVSSTAVLADRKGKGRQSSIPYIEISKSSSRAQRTPSTVQPSHRDRTARNEQGDHAPSVSFHRAHSAIPSSKKHRKEEYDPGEHVILEEITESDTLGLFTHHQANLRISPHPRDRKDKTRQKPAASQDSLVVTDGALTDGGLRVPQDAVSTAPLADDVALTTETTEESADSQETAPSLSASTTSTSTIHSFESQKEEPLDLQHELVCISSSDNEDEMLVLPEPLQPIPLAQSGAISSPKHSKSYRHSKAVEEGTGSVKKKVKFSPTHERVKERNHLRGHTRSDTSDGDDSPTRKGPNKRRRAPQEYFVGEAEDYRPSSSEEDEEIEEIEASQRLQSPPGKIVAQESAEGFGSSPLTPPTSSNSQLVTGVHRQDQMLAPPVRSELVALFESRSRTSISPRDAGKTNSSNKHNASQSNRTKRSRRLDYDDTDEDGEVPLCTLQSSNRPVIEKNTTKLLRSNSLPDQRVERPRRSTKGTTVRPLARRQDAQSGWTLFTRSRATGESADCRQCHRCETYQERNKTLRCMTCELAVCTKCLDAHYAGHPSYAATLAYMHMKTASGEDVDVSAIDFKCPVCKYLCRCNVCLRGPLRKAATSVSKVPPARSVSLESAAVMQRSKSLLSSDADIEPLQWPGLSRGTSTRPNLKVRLRVGRPSAASRLSKSAQLQSCSTTNACYDLQDAIAGEAARRAQVDAETDFVPVVSSRQPRKESASISPERQLPRQKQLGSTSLSPSSDSDDAVLVATSRSSKPRPAMSARVRLATKVGQQLGKSPAYVESRREPRREGDQLIPYNDTEPVLTLGPELDALQDIDVTMPTDGPVELNDQTELAESDAAMPEAAPAAGAGSDELLDSLLALPEDDVASREDDEANTPPLDDHPSVELDYLSPSDTVTTASVSSIASPPASEDRTVRFEPTADPWDSINSLQADQRLSSIFLPGIEDEFAFPMTLPTSTPTIKSCFLRNPSPPTSNSKTALFSIPSFSASYHEPSALDSLLDGSPSRNTAFDMDLMPEWTCDHYLRA